MVRRRHRATPCLAWAGMLALTSCAAPRGGTPEKPVAAGEAPASIAPAELEPTTRGFELGERYRYTLKLSTTVRFGESTGSFDFDLVGQVDVVPASVTPGGVMLHASFVDANVVNRLPATQSELNALLAELRASGAFFTLSGGLLSELRVPAAMSQMAASTYRQLAATLQFAHAKGDAKRYATEEFDTTGRYAAEYVHADDGKAWSKRKQRYLGLLRHKAQAGQSGVPIVPEIARSHAEVRLAPSGRPTSVKSLDELIVAGAQVPVRSTQTIALESVPAPAATPQPDFSGLLAGTRRFAAEEAIGDARAEGALDQARIGTLDFATIVARLEELAGQRTDVVVSDDQAPSDVAPGAEQARMQEDARLFHALSAILRSQPRAVGSAVAKVRAKSSAANVLMDALGSASTPDAHRALATLLGGAGVDPEVRGRIVLALARVRKPTPEATRALEAVLEAEPFHAGALYGIGTHARLLQEHGRSEESAVLGQLLLQRLGRAEGAMSKATVLKALANSGYAAALPSVLPHLESKVERVRAAALYALQSMRDSRVDGIVASRMASDESKQVRRAALQVAELREPGDELTRSLAHAATRDPDAHVRHGAVELAIRWLPKRSELRATLEEVARSDGEARIRERAQAAL